MAEEHIRLVSDSTVQNDGNNKTKKYRAYDYSLLFLTVLIVALGLVLLYSTSSYSAQKTFQNDKFFLNRQARFAVFGVILMYFVSRIDYHYYYAKVLGSDFLRLSSILQIVCTVLQVLVIIFGDERYGARRWIDIPVIGSFQPSEVSKISVIVMTAMLCYLDTKKFNKISGIIRTLVFNAPVILLVAKEDLSTAIVMAGIVFLMIFVGSKRWYWTLALIPFIGGAGFLLIKYGEAFRLERIKNWLDPDISGGYQVKRGLYAICSGGLYGKGLGSSSMKLGYVPEAHNDMIFSIICEELGILGAVSLIFLYVLIIWRIYVVCVHAPDLFGSMLCVGVMAHISLQVIINIAVVTNTVPATGIALPFISYGGTALILLLAEVGMVLAVSNQTEIGG